MADGSSDNRRQEKLPGGMNPADGNHARTQHDYPDGHQPTWAVAVGQPSGEGREHTGHPDAAAGGQPDAGAGPVGILQDVALHSAQHHPGHGRGHESPGAGKPEHQPAVVKGRLGTPVEESRERGRHRFGLYIRPPPLGQIAGPRSVRPDGSPGVLRLLVSAGFWLLFGCGWAGTRPAPG